MIENISNEDNVAGDFVDEVGLNDGTRLEALIMNVIKEELVNVVKAGGLTPDDTGDNKTQVRDAVVALIQQNSGMKLVAEAEISSDFTRSTSDAAGDVDVTNMELRDTLNTSDDAGNFDYYIEREFIFTSWSDDQGDNASYRFHISSISGGTKNQYSDRVRVGHSGGNNDSASGFQFSQNQKPQGGFLRIPNLAKAQNEVISFQMEINKSTSDSASVSGGAKIRLWRTPAVTPSWNKLDGANV